MNIGLLNLEPKYKNLALEKIRIYHQAKGNCVEDYFGLNHYDEVYCSSIFTFTKKHIIPERALCGGSGFNLITNLSPEVEEIKPHLNFGFTTRGCIRHCPFCIVPEKEGKVRVVGDLLDLWDGKLKDIVVMDNNILSIPSQFYKVCQQAIDNKIRLDFNQGLDHRLITPQIAQMMAKTSHIEYRLAFDHTSYLPTVEKAIILLREAGIQRANWYVLVGYNTTPKEDLWRLNYLRGMGQRAFVQRYETHYSEPFYQALSEWTNQHRFFATKTFEQFVELRADRRKNRKQIIKELE